MVIADNIVWYRMTYVACIFINIMFIAFMPIETWSSLDALRAYGFLMIGITTGVLLFTTVRNVRENKKEDEKDLTFKKEMTSVVLLAICSIITSAYIIHLVNGESYARENATFYRAEVINKKSIEISSGLGLVKSEAPAVTVYIHKLEKNANVVTDKKVYNYLQKGYPVDVLVDANGRALSIKQDEN